MRSLKELQKMAKNPFYRMTEAEKKVLQEAEKSGTTADSTEVQRKGPNAEQRKKLEATESDPKGKEVKATGRTSSKGNAAVKETGKLSKHSSDPVSE